MSAPRKDELARAWRAAERLVDERADAVAALSDEDFEREMRALPEPEHVPSVDALMARARRIATERSPWPAPSESAPSVPVGECESKLDDAAVLDPGGDRAPEVQDLRTRIAESRAAEAAPRPAPRPLRPEPEKPPRR